MENKENGNTFKKTVLLLSVALVIASAAVIALGFAASIHKILCIKSNWFCGRFGVYECEQFRV